MIAAYNIKIKYSQEGYLPNYPPHLISDEEMCEAFLTTDIENEESYSYFYDTYYLAGNSVYLPDNLLHKAYEELINSLRYHISRYLTKIESWYKDLPDWVISYMLGEVINEQSIQEDKHYLLVGLNRDNIDDTLTYDSQLACLKLSKRWVNKLDRSLKEDNVEFLLKDFSDVEKTAILEELDSWRVKFYTYTKDGQEYIDYRIATRPPTMFGEPHVIKLIRLNEVG